MLLIDSVKRQGIDMDRRRRRHNFMIEPSHLQNSSIIFSDGHLRLRRCRHGLMLFNLNDVYIGTMLDLYGEYCEGELDIFRQIIRPGMTIIEVGANIGAHTVPI